MTCMICESWPNFSRTSSKTSTILLWLARMSSFLIFYVAALLIFVESVTSSWGFLHVRFSYSWKFHQLLIISLLTVVKTLCKWCYAFYILEFDLRDCLLVASSESGWLVIRAWPKNRCESVFCNCCEAHPNVLTWESYCCQLRHKIYFIDEGLCTTKVCVIPILCVQRWKKATTSDGIGGLLNIVI